MVSPRRTFFTISAWSFTRFCCGRRIRKYMMTKISANGSSDCQHARGVATGSLRIRRSNQHGGSL